MKHLFHLLKFLRGFKILQKLFKIIFPKVSRNLTNNSRIMEPFLTTRSTAQVLLRARGSSSLAAAGRSSRVRTHRKRKRCLLSQHRAICIPAMRLFGVASTRSGRKGKERAVLIRQMHCAVLQRWALKQEVTEIKVAEL